MSFQTLIEQAKDAHRAGDLDAAENLYRQVLAGEPDNPDAIHLLGVVFHQLDRQEKSLELIRKALNLRPDHAASHNNLGKVLQKLGRHEEALASFQQAVKLQPDFAEAHNNLGTAYRETGDPEKAENAYRRALQCNPEYITALNNVGNIFHEKRAYKEALKWYGKALVVDHDRPLTHYNLGCTLLKIGRLSEAEAALDKALQGQPDMFKALVALGRLYHTRFQYGKAVRVLQQVIRLRPESADGYIILGDIFASMNRSREAVEALEKAVEIAPDSVRVLRSLGQVYRLTGRMDDASSCLLKARRLKPNNVGVIGNLAGLHISRGAFSEAKELCLEAIQLLPDFAPAYLQLAQLVRGEEGSRIADEISDLLREKKVTPPQKMILNFSLAKLLEDQERYAEAFLCLDAANRLKRSTYEFSVEKHAQYIDWICELYNEDVMHRYADKGHKSRVPVFILGMPRSGTTLIEQILASHPDVHGGGELQLVNEVVADYLGIFATDEFEYVQAKAVLKDTDLVPMGKEYVSRLRRLAPRARYITNKMPGNYMNLGLINLILPQAKIVHCMRNPMDNCLSIFKKLFTQGHQYGYDLGELGSYYLQYLRMMEHWRRVMPGRFLDFSYEELVWNQEARTRELLEFMGLEWHDGCMDFQNTDRPIHTASNVQVRQPLTDRSIGLWKHYEEQLRPLLAVLDPCPGNPVK